MFKGISIKDIFTLVLLIIIVVLGGYFYANSQARNKMWQSTYPVRAQLSNIQITCSENSPSSLVVVLKEQSLKNNSPSNQITYINSEGELYHCENGYKDEYPIISVPVEQNTRFRYASVTKLWTSDAILDLAKQGKLSLEDKLSIYITEINNPQDSRINDITIGELLLHRGGFNRYRIDGNDMFGIGELICPDNLDRLNEIELGFTPGTKMSYSNLGYCLLGEVISRVEGDSYTDIINNKYDFKNNSLKFISNSKLSDEVFYNYVETGLTGIPNIYTAFDYNALASSAGLSGNAIDLAKQVRKMAIKPEPNIKSIDNSIVCDTTKLRDCYGYAMFPYQKDKQSLKVYYRDGALLGLSTLVVVTEDNQVVTLLSNGTSDEGQAGSDKVKMLIYEALSDE